MFGIMMADYYLVKKQVIVLDDLYTMSQNGTYNYDGGWNRKGLIALAISAALSIGLSLAGAYGFDVRRGRLGLADRRRYGRARLSWSLRAGAVARSRPRGRVDARF